MFNQKEFQKWIEQTQVVRFPRHRINTFGAGEIQYSLVTSVSATPPQSTLRTGLVKTERPVILTPETFAKRFAGFGDDEDVFEGWLKKQFQEAFRALEYNFRNHLQATSPHSLDARELAENIRRDLDARDVPRAAVITGPEKGWTFSLMKFILEETTQSFRSNVRELEEHGLFDPAQAVLHRRRREIEALFRRAASDPAVRRLLAEKLKESGLFDEYQDRFFALARPSS